MTTPIVETPVRRLATSDDAYAIVNRYRAAVHDHTRLEALDLEFPRLSRRLKNLGAGDLFLLRADSNDAGTFKWRGAVVAMSRLAGQGVMKFAGASAGNHALGMAVATRELLHEYPEMQVYIAVPTTAPPAKRTGVRDRCASPQLQIEARDGDDTFDKTYARVIAHPELGTLISPFDDPNVIAGQGTIAADLIKLAGGRSIDHLVLPVGGGGLLAGIVQELARLDNTQTQIHIAEPTGSDSLSRSLLAGTRVPATRPNQHFGGSAVHLIGEHTFRIIWRLKDRLKVHAVTNEEIEELMYEYAHNPASKTQKTLYEPTTLAVLPVLERIVRDHPGESIVMIGTGHNAPLLI